MTCSSRKDKKQPVRDWEKSKPFLHAADSWIQLLICPFASGQNVNTNSCLEQQQDKTQQREHNIIPSGTQY